MFFHHAKAPFALMTDKFCDPLIVKENIQTLCALEKQDAKDTHKDRIGKIEELLIIGESK